MNTSELHIRDPFVVPLGGTYYLFGTTEVALHSEKGGVGFDFYKSRDLEVWDGPFPAFRPPDRFWADRDFWAAEVHHYRGRWFMFASFKARGKCRGTQILVSESIEGPYLPHSGRPVTPLDWECLDGTFYIDRQGQPWMIFCHEWTQVTNGEVCAVRLSDDLAEPSGSPILLFRASEVPWVVSYRDTGGLVTDGPFAHRTQDGHLLILWASFGKHGYAQGQAKSISGEIEGPWEHCSEPIFSNDGGHGMLFRTYDEKLMLVLHHPNKSPNERPLFLEVVERNGWIA